MIKFISKENIKDKKVLLRIDINSPVVKGKVLDNPRLEESAQTIKFLLKRKARLVVIAHQGRKGDDDFVSLKQHIKYLKKYSGFDIKYIDLLFEDQISNEIEKLKSGEAILLKNVREYDDEKDINNVENRYIEFSKRFDLYVNDAFSVSHREQGSIIIPPRYLNSYAGISMEKELEALKHFNFKDKRTLYFIGGSKIEDYLSIFNNLKSKKNKIIASGVLANLFVVAKGQNLGYENSWLKEKGYFDLIPKLRELLNKYPEQIILPIDFAIDKNSKREEHLITHFPMDFKIWDVGHKSTEMFKSEISKSDAVFLKGPLGYSELKKFSFATVEILKEISLQTKNKKIFSLLGGGHSNTSIAKYKIPDNFSHKSLSGGALIAYISGKELPGLKVLEK